jgi:hypothetical protein
VFHVQPFFKKPWLSKSVEQCFEEASDCHIAEIGVSICSFASGQELIKELSLLFKIELQNKRAMINCCPVWKPWTLEGSHALQNLCGSKLGAKLAPRE